MSEFMPKENVHSADLLQRAVRAVDADTPMNIKELCELGVSIQTSLREKSCDSPRINSDPAFRLVMISIGDRMDVGSFENFSACYTSVMDNVERLTDSPLLQRSKWADMAQSGAVNLTPMARSLLNAVTQVEAEGTDPLIDSATRLIAHQMSFIAQTNALTPTSDEASNLKAWCASHQAALSIGDIRAVQKTISP